MALVTEPTLTVLPNPAEPGGAMTATMEFPQDFFYPIRNISWEVTVTVRDYGDRNPLMVEIVPDPSPPYPLVYNWTHSIPINADEGDYAVIFRCHTDAKIYDAFRRLSRDAILFIYTYGARSLPGATFRDGYLVAESLVQDNATSIAGTLKMFFLPRIRFPAK